MLLPAHYSPGSSDLLPPPGWVPGEPGGNFSSENIKNPTSKPRRGKDLSLVLLLASCPRCLQQLLGRLRHSLGSASPEHAAKLWIRGTPGSQFPDLGSQCPQIPDLGSHPPGLGLFTVGLWPSHLSSAAQFPMSSTFCPKQPKIDASITKFPPSWCSPGIK